MKNYLIHYGVPGQKWGVRNGPPYPLGKQLKNKTPYKVDELKNYKGHLYFISEKNMDGATLSPRVPTNYFTENGYEDNWTKRICFSSSVDGCLKGLSQNNTGKTFNVYEAVRKPGQSVYKPNKGAVPDSDITGELWLKEPTKLKAVGQINCTGDDGKDGLPFEYGDGSAELYGWKYSWNNELKHYGIPGMKWGVRRYQNADGSWTEEGKKRRGYRDRTIRANKTKKDVDDIISTFDKNDRDKLALSPKEEYLTVEQGSTIAKRILEKDGDIPVSFFDVLEDGKNLNIALGTRSGDKYRGKGYAAKAVNKGMKWVNKHLDEYDKVVWGVRTDNEASIKLAKKYGFKEDPKSYSDDGKWVNYEKRRT